MASIDIAEAKLLLSEIEAEVRPLIMPYFACDGPDGEKGKWFRRSGVKEETRNPVQLNLSQAAVPEKSQLQDQWEELPRSFDIFSIPWQEREQYRYEGPEIIYTFWGKHGPCQREGCGHRTPIMPTPVVAIKTLSVDCWPEYECPNCQKTFDIERHMARMAPDSPIFVSPEEKPFAAMDDEGAFECPHCGEVREDGCAFASGSSSELGKAKSKQVELTLLIHPQWLAGCPKHDEQGNEYGGSATDPIEATIRWNNKRATTLRLLEVRGLVAVEKITKSGERKTVMLVPPEVTCPETRVRFFTDERGGTVPKQSTFACASDGSPNDVLTAIKATGKMGPQSAYVIQGYSPARHRTGKPYGGRFFAAATDVRRYNSALAEWETRKVSDLQGYWPTSELPFGFMTHMNNGGLPNHGYTHWWKMFNPLQLLLHAQLLKCISESKVSTQTKEFVLGAFQQYLRTQVMFTIWNVGADKLEPMFSNSNYHPKATTVENGMFSKSRKGQLVSLYRRCS